MLFISDMEFNFFFFFFYLLESFLGAWRNTAELVIGSTPGEYMFLL